MLGHTTWRGDFVSGVFYAAVDPDSPDAHECLKRLHQDDARQLIYITAEEWDRRVDAYGAAMAEEYGIDLADFDRADVETSYRNARARGAA